LVVVVVLGVELDGLVLESVELGVLELLPVLEPLELGEVELDLPAPIEPVLPLELPEAALPEVPSPAPLLQAARDRAPAAIRASAVPRVSLDAFIWELLGWDCVWRERENGSPRCLKSL